MKFLHQILRNAVSKTYNRISDLRKEIQSLKKGLQVAKEASAKSIKELEEAKSVLEIVEGQPAPVERPGRIRRLELRVKNAEDEERTIEESLEVKGAFLARALEESKVHYLFLLDFLLICMCIDILILILLNLSILWNTLLSWSSILLPTYWSDYLV